MGSNEFGRNSQEDGLHLIGVGHYATDEYVRAARNLGQTSPDQAPRTRLRDTERQPARPESLEHDRGEVRLSFCIDMISGTLPKKLSSETEPLIGFGRCHVPRTQPKVNALEPREVGERDRRDLLLHVAHALS